jgi:hypothetical protein
MSNILKAILAIAELKNFEVSSKFKSKNRIQQAGESLEYFIKDAFSDAFGTKSDPEKDTLYSNVFSYLGNANNPPDIMLKGGDAIEIKKTTSVSQIALNSSYPKNKLYAHDKLITLSCKICEEWTEKDIIYAVGTLKDEKLHSLWFVYGSVYAADKTVYERIGQDIIDGLKNIEHVQFAQTNELGRVNKVDPLGITYLRVRGMWGIEHPQKVFSYLPNLDDYFLHALIPEAKFNAFPQKDQDKLAENTSINMQKLKIKNPNNPAQLIPCVYLGIRRQA